MLQNKFKQKNYVILTIEYQYYTHLNVFVVSYKNLAPHSFIWEFIEPPFNRIILFYRWITQKIVGKKISKKCTKLHYRRF